MKIFKKTNFKINLFELFKMWNKKLRHEMIKQQPQQQQHRDMNFLGISFIFFSKNKTHASFINQLTVLWIYLQWQTIKQANTKRDQAETENKTEN